jgi:IclR family transcriptional regulator, acetate operon repressor
MTAKKATKAATPAPRAPRRSPPKPVASADTASNAREDAPRSTTAELLKLIEELATFDRIGVTRLARHLDVPVANAHRMLRVLERTGFVEQMPDSKEYRLTLKLFEIGSQVASRTTMRDIAALEIERLAQQTATATNVGVLIDDYVLYLGKVETDEVLTLNLRPGSRVPAVNTAMGKAMLAADDRPVESILGPGPYLARTEFSVTTLDELQSDLAEIRRRGFAVDRQELSVGLWCVAAPIVGPRHTQNGAVSTASYGAELSEKEIDRLGQLVMACAARISRKVGGLYDHHAWDMARTSYPRP